MRVMRSATVIAGVVFVGSSLRGSGCLDCWAAALDTTSAASSAWRVIGMDRLESAWDDRVAELGDQKRQMLGSCERIGPAAQCGLTARVCRIRLRCPGMAGRIANAAVVKAAVRKDLGVRIPRPPSKLATH